MSQAEAKTDNARQRRARLAALLREGSSTRVPQPLSEGQRAIWYISELDPNNSSLNLGEAVRVRGGLERSALEQALRGLLQRHELLRSRVARLSGEPFLVVEPARELPLETLLTTDDSEAALASSVGSFIDRRFDLERELPCRFALRRTAGGDDVLVFALHHVVGEFASLLILIGELLELYAAAVGGHAPRLDALTARYQDFVVTQAQYLRDPAAIGDAEYWTHQLQSAPGPLAFPVAIASANAELSCLRSFVLPTSTALAVRELSRRLEVSAYATLLSAFTLLLSRRYGERDLIVGAPVTGRAEARFENVVGYFDNPLPLRFHAEPGTSVADFIRSTRKTVLEAIEHQRYPLQRIVEDQRARGRSGAEPLFNTMFVMRQSPRRDLQELIAFGMGDSSASTRLPSGLEVASVPLHRRRAQFDLALSLAEVQGRLVGSWELDPARFPAQAVTELSEALAGLLAEMVRRPDAPIDELPALSARERAWLVTDCNATQAELGPDLLLHEPVEARMKQQPDAVALVAGELEMSFGELDRRSRAVARWLFEYGVSTGEHVAVVMEKGWEQVVAVLGALRAGAAYLPIDAKLPALRREQLLTRGEARFVLTQTRWHESTWPAGVACLDVSLAPPSDAPLPRSPAGPAELAYTIFTSGSTGEPKGVMIHHRGALNTLRDVNERLAVAPGDAVLGLSALSFDLSVYDIFGVLGAGATLVLPDAERLYEPAHWVALVEQHGVTLWNSVPSFFKLALEHVESQPASAQALRSLRAVFLSGDWIPLDLPARARRACGGHRFISMGGATEGSVWSIWYEVQRIDPSWASIPYGYPMTNQHFHVLDEAGQPCPVGVTGELYIGGVGVLLGYWRAPELDARALREVDGIPGRLYRTGDLGRRHASGHIEFLGRADFQVKVRGFRVELGEIEAALLRHSAVREVVVTALRRGDENRLVAYVVSTGATGADELRAHLAAHLPSYMVPSCWVFMDALPLSSNGKLDRKALPEPEASRVIGVGERTQKAVTEAQRALVGIVGQTLALGEVGLADDLLALGADSIQLIRIAARLREAGYAITSRDLFETTGLEALAERLQKEATRPASLPTLPWQRLALEQGATRYKCLLSGPAHIDTQQVGAAWSRLIERHDALQLTVDLHEQRLSDVATLDRRKHVAFGLDVDEALAVHEAANERDGALLTVGHEGAGVTLLLSAPASLTDAFGFRVLVEELVGELSPQPLAIPAASSFMSWVASRQPSSGAFPDDARSDSCGRGAFATLESDAGIALSAAETHRLGLAELVLLAADRARPAGASCIALHARHGVMAGKAPRIAPLTSELRHVLDAPEQGAHCLRRLEQLQAPSGAEHEPDLALVVVDANGAERALRDSRFKALRWTDQVVVDRKEPCVVLLEEQRDERGTRLVWHCWSTRDETPETTLSKLSSALMHVAEELAATPAKTRPQHFPLARLDATSLERLRTRYPRLEDVWELGPMQHTMLLHAAVAEAPGLYCHHVHWDVTGELDLPRLRRAFDLVLAELPNLRVAFELEASETPLQVVLPLRSPRFEVEQVAPEQLDARLRALIAADRELGFDLRRPPLLRVTLLRVSAQLHRLVVCHHHLLFDGWSVGLLQQRLLSAYAGETPAPSTSFQSFISWSARQPRAERAAYFGELLAGAPQATPFGFQDRRPGPRQAFVHDELEAVWDDSFVRGLEQAARAARVTPGSALLAAWGLLLARYAERDDVVFGVTGSGRPESLPGASEIVGLLINSVPLRVRLSPDTTLRELVRDVQAQYAASRLHEQVSLRELTEQSGARDFRPFESLVIFENFEGNTARALGGLSFSPFEFSEQTNAPIALYVLPGPAWTLRVTFDATRFCRASLATLVEQLRCCLEAFVTGADTLAKHVSLASRDERAGVTGFNDTRVDWPEDSTLCDLLAKQAQLRPDAVAVVDGERQLTYAALRERARAWAHVLAGRGVQPGHRVGLSCRRSAEWLIALYAILEAGACYVPLDDAAPPQRNQSILQDAGAQLLLTDGPSASGGELRAASILLVDSDAELKSACPAATEPAPRPGSESPAYVIYTSGSTGTPKGVVVSHGAVANYARGTAVTYGFAASDRILQFFSPSFDGAGEEIFGALANGATLVLRADDALSSFQRLGEHLQERAVTALSLPTAVWHAWTTHLEESGASLPAALRTVIIGGERALPTRVASWRRLTAGTGPRLFNSYGPTEATIVALVADLSEWDAELERDREIPIGRPVPNVQAFLVDAAGQPSPRGAPGELLIAGKGLAQGYLGRPALTAERFVELAAWPGLRLYRTGDRARFRDDGQLEFLGRLDEQVKIRGYRVELGEIEHVLLAQATVKEAVVTAVASGDHALLIAHVVPAASQGAVAPDLAQRLRDSLRSELPSYMVPAAIGIIEALPLNERGKLDRSRLPPLAIDEATGSRPPSTARERAIATIWAEVLGLSQVNVDQEFFDAGGHSLAALRLLGRLQQELGLKVSLRELYAAPTVARLAQLGEQSHVGGDNALLDLMRQDAALPLPSFAGEPPVTAAPRAILLTGATGFLGTFLLGELLASTRSDIWCLVRDGQQSFARMERALRRAGLWRHDAVTRLRPVTGDLATARLGLSDADYALLSERIELVVHNGARVSFVDPYETLRAANVLGTRSILELCAAGRRKSLHYVSTLAVFDPNAASGSIDESWLPEEPLTLPSGYGQSKWVAEQLVARALRSGLPGVVYRPGRISGHSSSGAWQDDDLACQMLAACAAVGKVPALDMVVDLTPVDYVAKAVVSSLLRGDSGGLMHLTNPGAAQLLQVSRMLADSGLSLTTVDLPGWIRAIGLVTQGDASHPWAQLAALVELWQEALRPPSHGAPSFSSQATAAVLAVRDIRCAALDQRLLGTYLGWMRGRGLLANSAEAR